MPSGLKVEDVKVGSGALAERGSYVTLRFRGTLNRGDEIGAGEVSFRVGDRSVIAGFDKGIVGMRVGGIRRLRISPHLGYRDRTVGRVPANAVLNFEVELLEGHPTPSPVPPLNGGGDQ
jgi:FKBP-type peptidyl-prolyl cis-trans isomerase